MSVIKITVNDQNLLITDGPKIAAQGVNENYIQFTFSEDWDGFGKTANFYRDTAPTVIYQSVVDQNGYAAIPHEITANESWICIGLSGVKDDVVKTSEILKYKIVNGLYVVESTDPTPDVYEQILALAGNIEALVTQIETDTAASVAAIEASTASSIANIQETVDGIDDAVDQVDARMDTFIASQTGTSNGTLITETSLFTASSPAKTDITVSDDINNYDYIDIRYAVFGRTKISRFLPSDIETGVHWSEFEHVNTIDIDTGATDPNARSVLRKVGFKLTRASATSLSFELEVWRWDGKSTTNGVNAETIGSSWNVGIYSITGVKYEAAGTSKDAELADIRVGADGVTYATAGEAVRTQFTNADNEISELKEDLNVASDDVNIVFQNNLTRNLANPADFVEGEYVNQTNGNFSTSSSYSRTGYIPVVGGLTYCLATYENLNGSGLRYAFYDADKVFISGAYPNHFADIGYLLTAPTNARYIALSITKVQMPVMVARSNTKIDFVPYGITDKLKLDASPIIPSNKADFMNNIINLVNPASCVEGYYVNQETGAFASNSDQERTDYIPVDSYTTYQILFAYGTASTTIRYAFYDANKTYITGGTESFSVDGNSVFTHPYAKYMVLSCAKNRFPVMIAKSDTTVPFTNYGQDNKTLKYAYLPTVRTQDTMFFVHPNNLVNPADCVVGEFVNQATGAFQSNSAYTRTTYLEIESLQKYCIAVSTNRNLITRYAFYNSSKTYITGGYTRLADIGYLVTAPANAKYLAISIDTTVQMIMVSKSDARIYYSAYGDNDPYVPYANVGKDKNPDDIIVNLPTDIYALVGFELNIYFENLTEDWERYDWNVDCTRGKQFARGYKITPTSADVLTQTSFTLTVTDKVSGNIKQVVSNLHIIASNAGSGAEKKIIILGDSTTNNGIAVTKLNENFADDVMSIQTIGTRGTVPNKHEGRSGWTFYNYFHDASGDNGNVLNPFYNPVSETFDADYYFTNSGVDKPDWFFINLGINDCFNFKSDYEYSVGKVSLFSMCQAMIESILDASPNTKIGLCLTIPPNDSQVRLAKNMDVGRHVTGINEIIYCGYMI